jgi:BASS family bile acid:Na+ symporter
MGIVRFLKDWTLPVAMTIGTVVYLVFAFTPALEPVAVWFAPIGNDILPVFMFFILFVTFCKVDFRHLRPVWWHFWVGLFQIIFVAALVAVVLLLKLEGSGKILVESVLTCVIGPVAAAAAVVTAKLGGNLEEMTTYTFISNIICALLIPVAFPLIEKDVDMSFMAAFSKILYEVCVVLLVPMLLAYIVKHHLHKLHLWIVSVKDLSYYLWGCSLMIVTGTTVKNIVHANASVYFILLIAVASLAMCLLQFASGRHIGSYFNNTINAGQALGQKNTAFAIWIAYSYLNPLSSVGPGCYILWQNIINSIEIWDYRRRGLEKSA